MQIQTISACSADCLFCPHSESWHARNPGRMDEALWQKLLGDLQPFAESLAKGMVSPYLMNEPLLDPKIYRRIDEIYEALPGTMVQVATNGSALTDRNIDRLLAALDGRKHQIWVSHHGVGPWGLRHLMRVEPVRAERNLVALLKRAAGRFRILLRGAGRSLDGTRHFFSSEQYRAYWARLFDEHQIDTTWVHVDALQFHDRAGGLRREERGASGLSAGVVREIGPDSPFSCPRLDRWLHVGWDGRILLCCMDYHREIALPSLREVSVFEYLNSPEYGRLADQVTGRVQPVSYFICNRCTSPGG